MAVDPTRVEILFFATLDQPLEEREAYLQKQCEETPELLTHVAALLQAQQANQADRFLAEPIVTRAARNLSSTGSMGFPKRLGDYDLLEVIGRGGMGIVYRAYDYRRGCEVALKTLPPLTDLDPSAQQRFEREIAALQRLHHPYFVHALAADTIDGALVLVMEYIKGETFQKLVSTRGPLGVKQACSLIAQTARGIHHAHEIGVIHRDIKPSNVMQTPQGAVKILDLGLAFLLGSVPGMRALTATGMMVGTLDYMAPEQVEAGSKIDCRADLYSLGATLFFLLTGRAPFAHHETLAGKIGALKHEQPPVLNRSDVPPVLARLISALLAKNAHQRPANARVVAESLEAIIERSETTEVATPVSPAAKKRFLFCRSRRLIFALLLVGTVGFGAHILEQLLQPGELFMQTDVEVLKIRIEIVVLVGSLCGMLYASLRKYTHRILPRLGLTLLGLVLIVAALAWDWPMLIRELYADVAPAPLQQQPPSKSHRTPLGLIHVWKSMQQHQATVPVHQQAAQRYISVTHLHDNPTVSDEELEMWRAAIPTVLVKGYPKVKLEAVDAPASVFVLDLDADPHLDQLWSELTAGYPFGRVLDNHADLPLRDAARTAMAQAGTLLPVIHGDWLMATVAPDSEQARRFRADLDLATASAELGCTPDQLRNALAHDMQLQPLSLTEWSRGAKVPRVIWTGRVGINTRFQTVAHRLGLGYPLHR